MRVGLISLGCAKNLVDAEVMLGTLMKDGFEITNDAASADVLIVNTCSFIDSAQEESVNAILESAELREAKNRGQGLVVSGCLPQRFREELPKLLPEVDAFMGIDQVAQVSEIVQRALGHRSSRLEHPADTPEKRRSRIVACLNRREEGHESGSRGEEFPRRATASVGQAGASQPSAARGGLRPEIDSRPSQEPWVSIHARPTYIPDYTTPRFRLTPRHFAYVKIAEGCNHPCSFCTIPRMRGSHRSRPQHDIVEEARRLIDRGVKELNLISQDSTYYGLDLRPRRRGFIASPEKFSEASRSLPADATTLCTLLRALNALPGEFWIRLLYTHPAHWTDELIQTMAECPKVARYADMPLQHIHDNMLERMRRETSRQYIVDLIARIRAGIPGIALRTTFIVGFPGETEACFEALLDFIRETKFERLGVFTYSREEGTRAAKMLGQISSRVKEQRRRRAMAAQLEASRKIGQSFLGREIMVLAERTATAAELQIAQVASWEHGLIRTAAGLSPKWKGRFCVARGEADAPDIDGRIYVRGQCPPGEFAKVKIVGHTDYDLIARPLEAGISPA
ncbi:MAG: 30S ribosomal protein S12 methylthiotransferase RimO [Verrucomicrobia bacterium]|nr:30S ribosomal protein S12 methylthiotransferase RimO [Verrucomicrobiota bacterium]